MKLSFSLLLLSFVFIACQNSSDTTKSVLKENSAYTQLSAAEFKAKLATIDKPQLIDVRTPREFEKGNIAGAKMINFKDRTFATEMAKLDKNRPLFIYCQSGGRSLSACNQMVADGFTEVYELKGGYGAWK